MKITVGIPHYRSIKSLNEVLEGLNNQKLNNLKWYDIEVIVSNDENFDISNKFKKKYNYKISFLYGINGGPAVARNRVINIAKGKYLLFLDSDSVPDLNWIEQMNSSLSDKCIYAVGGYVLELKGKGLVNEYFNTKNYLNKPITDYKTGDIISLITANCGFQLDLLKKIKGFDEKVFGGCNPGGEDVDLCYRIRKLGYKLSFNQDAITYHIFPSNFIYIISKARNYGFGIKKYIKARNINPTDIRQPKPNLLGIANYFIYRQNKIFNFWIMKKISF